MPIPTTIAKGAITPQIGLAERMKLYSLLYSKINEIYEDSPELHKHRDVTLDLLKKKANGNSPPLSSSSSKPTVIIAGGHSRRGDQGAWTMEGGVSEHAYNSKIAKELCELLEDSGLVTPVVIDSYGGKTYTQAIKWLSEKVNSFQNVALCVELHFNASGNPKAKGHEFLFWHSSKKGKEVAECFSKNMSEFFPSLVSRGAKPIKSGQRGSMFLRKLSPVCLIAEPFFGSSAIDWGTFRTKKGQKTLVDCYFEAVLESVL